jgi:hypothetical protein
MTELSLTDIFATYDIASYLFQFLVKERINLTMIVLSFVCKDINHSTKSILNAIYPNLAKPIKYSICKEAAISGNIQILQWVRYLGFQ